ncbi:MAG: hypothetical protein AB7V43_04800 [Acidimicrobiia bacterium]
MTIEGDDCEDARTCLRCGDRSALGALVLIAVVSLVEQVRQLASFGRRNVTEDQALLWVVARDLGHGSVPQPTFYGQDYGTAFEAAPVEVARRLGFALPTAVPLVLSGLALLGWWLIGAASYRRGHRVLACVAVGAPVLIATEYSFMVSTYPTGLGRLLAAACVAAIVMVDGDRPAWMAVASLCGGLAYACDASTAMVVVPAIGYALLCAPVGRRLKWTAVGAIGPVVWLTFLVVFFDRHGDYALHPGPSFSPSWSVLRSNLETPGRHFGVLAPELARVPVVPWLLIGAIVLALLIRARHRRSWAAIASVVGVLVVTVTILSVPRSIDGWPNSIYLRPARVLLVFPVALWFCAYVANQAGVFAVGEPSTRTRIRRWSTSLVVVLVVISAGVRLVRFEGERDRTLSAAEATWQYQPWRAEAVAEVCASIDSAARAAAVDAPVVFLKERLFAYACAASWGDTDATLFPEYERRTWLLHEAERIDPGVVMFYGATESSCQQWISEIESCAVVGEGLDAVVVRPHAGRTLMQTLIDLGITVRPYGAAMGASAR